MSSVVVVMERVLGGRHDVEELRCSEMRAETNVDEISRLYAEEHVGMVKLAHLMTGSLSIAEEIVQDAFVAVFEHAGALDRPGAYLRRVVVNKCHTSTRRSALERAKLKLFSTRPESNRFVLNPEMDEMWRSLQLLSNPERVAIVLRFYQDLTVAQIAAETDEKPGTIKSRISRGLSKLRAEIVQ